MTPNNTAAPINAVKMLTDVYTAKMVAMLRPIKAAKPCNINCAADLETLCREKLKANTATKGAKITTHFSAVPNNTAINAGLVDTM
jgi:hypothetical protein